VVDAARLDRSMSEASREQYRTSHCYLSFIRIRSSATAKTVADCPDSGTTAAVVGPGRKTGLSPSPKQFELPHLVVQFGSFGQ
jgi:hypothetical protein